VAAGMSSIFVKTGKVKNVPYLPTYPLETILLSICLEHEKMLGDILEKLKEKEGEMELNQNKMEKG
jgi:hypothetical protein